MVKPKIANRRSCKGDSLVGGKLSPRRRFQPTTSDRTIRSVHLNITSIISIIVTISIIIIFWSFKLPLGRELLS